MKRILILCLCLLISFSAAAVFAFSVKAAPVVSAEFGKVYKGEHFSVILYAEGGGVYGVSGSFSYDESKMALDGVLSPLNSPYKLETGTNSFLVYDTSMRNPINSHTAVLELEFRLLDGVGVGEELTFSFNSLTLSDGESDYTYGKSDFKASVLEAPEENLFLSSLTVDGYALSPAFSKDVYNYSVTVDGSVKRLSVKAVAEDPDSKVEISGEELAESGTSEVTVKVTGKRGGERTYLISVQKEAVTSGGVGNIAALAVEGFPLSPQFNPSRTKYAVYVPYETTSVKIISELAEEGTEMTVVGNEDLSVGDNVVKVTLNSPDGKNDTYEIKVVRAPMYSGKTDNDPSREINEAVPTGGMPVWLVLLLCAVFLTGGAFGGYFLHKRFPDGLVVAFKKRFGRTKLYK